MSSVSFSPPVSLSPAKHHRWKKNTILPFFLQKLNTHTIYHPNHWISPTYISLLVMKHHRRRIFIFSFFDAWVKNYYFTLFTSENLPLDPQRILRASPVVWMLYFQILYIFKSPYFKELITDQHCSRMTTTNFSIYDNPDQKMILVKALRDSSDFQIQKSQLPYLDPTLSLRRANLNSRRLGIPKEVFSDVSVTNESVKEPYYRPKSTISGQTLISL